MGVSNPTGCCGYQTLCCPDASIPDRLTATVSTDCGDFTIPMANVTVVMPPYQPIPTWKGTGTIICHADPSPPCIPYVREMSLSCLGINLFYFGWGILDLVSCSPLVLSGTVRIDGCTHDVQVTITE